MALASSCCSASPRILWLVCLVNHVFFFLVARTISLYYAFLYALLPSAYPILIFFLDGTIFEFKAHHVYVLCM